VNAAAQAAASELKDRFDFEANAETGTIEAAYPGRVALLLEGGFGRRVRGRLGLAIALSRATSTGVTAVAADIPHPFFDERHRHVEGEAPGISRTETAAHLQLYYDLAPRGRWRTRLFAGPSYFNVEQELVTDVQAEEAFPFDTADFHRATSTLVRGSALGFNAAIDLSRMLSRRVGAGVQLRYARAGVDLDAPGARTVSVDGGGFQVGGGVRVIF
jgi:hypothetical protein